MRLSISTLLFAFILFSSSLVRSQTITTFAGNNSSIYPGDGYPATSSGLSVPVGVARDTAGNIYIVGIWDNAVRKVNRYGIMSTVAGNGTSGFSGDGGLAVSAQLHYPNGIAIDKAGNLYIADLLNARIRKINNAGIITTIAGTGTQGYSGDGGSALAAKLNWPSGVAVDTSGNVYIADEMNARIRKIDASSGTISTFAGTGIAGFSGDGGPAAAAQISPSGVAIGKDGSIYIVDNNAIRKVNAAGTITTIAGAATDGDSGDGGPATAAKLSTPSGIVDDGYGNVYISDGGNAIVRKINTSGIINTFAGNHLEAFTGDGGPATIASLNGPGGLTLDDAGNLYFADTYNHRVRKVSGIHGATSVCAGSTATLYDDIPGGTWYSSAPGIATINATGVLTGIAVGSTTIYYVVGLDTAKASLAVIDTLPGIAPVTGPSILCVGGASTFTDTIPGGTWSSANAHATITAGVATGVTNGADTIIYTTTNACGTSSATMVVTVNTASADYITGVAAFCEGATTTLSDPVSGGTWASTNPGIATMLAPGIVKGIIPGIDTITYVVSQWGCFDTAYYTVVVVQHPVAGSISGSPTVCTGAYTILTSTEPGGAWGSWSATNGHATVTSAYVYGIVTGATAGIDTILHINSNVCGTLTASFAVTVNTADAGTITGDTAICVGHTVVLYDSAVGGTWINGNPSIASDLGSGSFQGLTAGVDTIVYAVSYFGCYDTATYTVEVLATPDAGSVSGINSFCIADTTTLIATIPGGVWFSSNPAVASVSISGLITGVSPGVDTIIYTVSAAGCSASATFPIEINSICGPDNVAINGANNNTLSIYPNPCTDHFTIELPDLSKDATISLFDLVGKEVTGRCATRNGDLLIYQTGGLPRGVYMLRVQSSDRTLWQKVILE